MQDAGQQILALIRQYGAEIGAGAALLFFMFEVFTDLGRKERRGIGANLKSLALLAAATGTMAYAYWAWQRDYEPVSDANRAAREIVEFYDTCRERLATLPEAEQAEIIGERLALVSQNLPERIRARAPRFLLQQDCLALAMRRIDLRRDHDLQVTRLSRDVELGHQLLANADDDTTIGGTLYYVFGVSARDFLGVGRSLPAVEEQEKGLTRYNEAMVREYWTPNLCAVTIAADICPERSPRVWGWRFADFEAIDGMTIRELLMSVEPDEGGDTQEFARLRARLDQPGGLETPYPILVRLHIFSESIYMGTTGRPEAQYVFFSSLADVIDRPVRDSYRLSGADEIFRTSERANDTRGFVWVYAPQRMQDYRVGTWGNLYQFLRDTPVHPRAAEVANAATWPPPEEGANR